MSYPTVHVPICVGDEALSVVKKSKLIDIYYNLINVEIDKFKAENDTEKRKDILKEIFELIDMLECVELKCDK